MKEQKRVAAKFHVLHLYADGSAYVHVEKKNTGRNVMSIRNKFAATLIDKTNEFGPLSSTRA